MYIYLFLQLDCLFELTTAFLYHCSRMSCVFQLNLYVQLQLVHVFLLLVGQRAQSSYHAHPPDSFPSFVAPSLISLCAAQELICSWGGGTVKVISDLSSTCTYNSLL